MMTKGTRSMSTSGKKNDVNKMGVLLIRAVAATVSREYIRIR